MREKLSVQMNKLAAILATDGMNERVSLKNISYTCQTTMRVYFPLEQEQRNGLKLLVWPHKGAKQKRDPSTGEPMVTL